MPRRRRYTDDDRATALAVLAANRSNVEKTAGILGIPETTLRQWAKGGRHPEAAQMSGIKRAELADAMEELAWRCLEAITPEILRRAKPLDLVKASAIAIDKALLLRSAAADARAVAYARLSDEELQRELEAVYVRRGLLTREKNLKLFKAKLGPEHPDTLASMHNLAAAYQDAGKLDLALPLHVETLKLWKAKLGPEHPDTLVSMGDLGKAYCDANQGEKAAATFKEFVAGRRKRSKPDDPQFAGLLAQVALDLSKCRQHAAAEELLRECLAIREKTQPDAWTTFSTKSLLGGALLGRNKYADAEPLLLAGYEGMKQRFDKTPGADAIRLAMMQHIPEAIDRLIELSTATNKPDEVKKWQAERAKYPAMEKKK